MSQNIAPSHKLLLDMHVYAFVWCVWEFLDSFLRWWIVLELIWWLQIIFYFFYDVLLDFDVIKCLWGEFGLLSDYHNKGAIHGYSFCMLSVAHHMITACLTWSNIAWVGHIASFPHEALDICLELLAPCMMTWVPMSHHLESIKLGTLGLLSLSISGIRSHQWAIPPHCLGQSHRRLWLYDGEIGCHY